MKHGREKTTEETLVVFAWLGVDPYADESVNKDAQDPRRKPSQQ